MYCSTKQVEKGVKIPLLTNVLRWFDEISFKSLRVISMIYLFIYNIRRKTRHVPIVQMH